VRTLPYYYMRALELEGRHPADAGCWPVTMHRLEVGEGLPRFETSWASVTFSEGEPFPLTSRPPPEVLWRNFYYRRVRSSGECDHQMLIDPMSRPRPAFHLTAAWANPPGGVIPLPSAADPPIPHTHSAVFISRIPDRHLFHFKVKWRDWGDHGTGYMPYEYFDRYVFECWATYSRPDVLKLFQIKRIDNEGRVRWSARDEEDHRVYAFEVHDPRSEERRAWTFVVERDGALEVEELYVRPEYRRVGHGRWLAERVAELSRRKRMPIRLWLAFADCKSESETNYSALVSTARRLGVQFQPCPVPWAAYFATTEQHGEEFPVEPTAIPGRPRASRNELRAFVLALSLGQGGVAELGQGPDLNVSRPPVANVIDDLLAVNSPAWDAMNERRAALILMDLDEGLTAAEREEYERLQSVSLAAAALAFPCPKLDFGELTRLREELGAEHRGSE
jgi:GNAT superfamily N-acetyltransferase